MNVPEIVNSLILLKEATLALTKSVLEIKDIMCGNDGILYVHLVEGSVDDFTALIDNPDFKDFSCERQPYAPEKFIHNVYFRNICLVVLSNKKVNYWKDQNYELLKRACHALFESKICDEIACKDCPLEKGMKS